MSRLFTLSACDSLRPIIAPLDSPANLDIALAFHWTVRDTRGRVAMLRSVIALVGDVTKVRSLEKKFVETEKERETNAYQILLFISTAEVLTVPLYRPRHISLPIPLLLCFEADDKMSFRPSPKPSSVIVDVISGWKFYEVTIVLTH
ncbi:hypothetical protein CEXT_88671 [Caerostris extrusa]|uniref:Uncharacterized protein n=1 Tax=Caerostris extrusa TaxID=172846 RepID=A0AAV4X8E8_CAEEX|nr:hypothetical protein CEXT_88671 [Caerostris extrusa]